jgi:hypothetical protein
MMLAISRLDSSPRLANTASGNVSVSMDLDRGKIRELNDKRKIRKKKECSAQKKRGKGKLLASLQ